jgi:predicted metal-dependent HD superfamily phosphohydrolase
LSFACDDARGLIVDKFKWLELMARIGLDDNIRTYNELLSNYNQKHRHYHNVNHITAVLASLDKAKQLANDHDALEIALWFHDAIYKPFSSTNELDSANWASTFLEHNGASKQLSSKVHVLIMATLHDAIPIDSDEKLIADIDLSILGSSPKMYDWFESCIRKEYKLVPILIYRKKRKEILTSFLERDRIYSHDYFHEKLENNARANITNAIQNL